MANYIRVFQMGFDIAQGEDVSDDDIDSLFNALEEQINNFYDKTGKKIEFQSVGCFNIEDMSHAYREEELKQLS